MSLPWMSATGLLAGGDAPVRPFEIDAPVSPEGQIDRLVFGRLERAGIQPARLCSDAVFVRRAYLDVIGTLPTAEEARAFLRDSSRDKRTALIDRLMERDEFVDYWALKWSDLLRLKAEFPINLWPNAVQAYYRYIRTSVKENKPYDQFARELLTSSGSNFRVGQVNFYRAVQNRDPAGLAQVVALTLMGARADKWPKERLTGMAQFFTLVAFKPTGEWKEEIIHFDRSKSVERGGTFPDGISVKFTPDQDPREVFANWLISPKNPWFGKAIANRVWSWIMGRGIVHEVDDMRPDNPAKNPELLDYLEKQLIAARWDLRALMREILKSKVYQLSSIPRSKHADAESLFASYSVRRLDAEVLIDAVCQITGTNEKYQSPIPEPFTFIPEKQRSIALSDGSITSSFLELFGRPARDTGFESERNNRPSAGQRLHMLNSSHVLRKLENSRKLQYSGGFRASTREITDGIYLAILSRYPTEEESRIIGGHGKTFKSRDAMVDLAWALINSPEFLYRH